MEKIGESVNIKKIAITGGLSAGKSVVAERLKTLGAFVIKADDIVHTLLSKDVQIIQKIKEMFNINVSLDEPIDRSVLAAIVFNDPKKLTELEAVLHPKVIEIIKKTYLSMKNQTEYKAFAVEFPLLFEIGFDAWFDEIIYVTSESTIQKERFKQRGFSENQFTLRQKRFLNEDEKKGKSTLIIENNSSLENLYKQVERIL